jgi:hypothetical protein
MLTLHAFKPKAVLTKEDLASFSKERRRLARLTDVPDEQKVLHVKQAVLGRDKDTAFL